LGFYKESWVFTESGERDRKDPRNKIGGPYTSGNTPKKERRYLISPGEKILGLRAIKDRERKEGGGEKIK